MPGPSPALPRPHLAPTAAAQVVVRGHAPGAHPLSRVSARGLLPRTQAPRSALPRGGEWSTGRRLRRSRAGGRAGSAGEEGAAGEISVPSTPSSAVDSLPGGRAGFIPGMRSTWGDLARGEGRRGGGTPRGYVMDGPPRSQASSLEDCPTLPGEHLSKQRGPVFPERTFPCRVKEQDLEKERKDSLRVYVTGVWILPASPSRSQHRKLRPQC